MKFSKKFKKLTAHIILFTMVFTLLPWTSLNKVKAADIILDEVIIGKVYDEDINQQSMYVEIYAPSGQDISELEVYYQTIEGLKELTNKTISGKRFIKFVFPTKEMGEYGGSLFIGESIFVQANFNELPTLTNVPKKIINSEDIDEKLVIKGNNLDNINKIVSEENEKNNTTDNFTIKGYIKKGASSEEMTNITSQTETEIELSNPKPPGEHGIQNIIFTKAKEATTDSPSVEIRHTYQSQFQFVKNLVADDINMYPNVGAKRDRVYFEGKDLQDYNVYFLNINGADTFSSENKGEKFENSFEENIDGQGTNRLTIIIPDTLFIGKYNIALTEDVNGETISQTLIRDDDNNDAVFTIIDKSNKATIDTIYPTKGADLGGETVEILGNNLVNLNIEGLDIDYKQDDLTDSISSNGTELTIEYPDGKYNNSDVINIKRNISVIIGKQALIKKDELDKPDYILGYPDHLYVTTQQITDVEDDPVADVTVIITTTFEENGTEYKFVEIAERKASYKFIPSSIQPTIDSSTPDRIQVVNNNSDYKLKNDTLVVINGQDFMVNRYVSNSTKDTKYPIVLIKNEDDLNEDNYEIKIDKQQNKIFYYEGNVKKSISDIEFLVLDKNDNIVTGSEGNELGTRILFKLPKEITLANIGKKNVQILNPRKGSELNGDTNISVDLIDFIIVGESPVIESVKPNIVTVDGGEDITISGSNFHEGVKIYIDGKEVNNVNRDIDTQGNKIVLTFKAPKGREGTTQLQVINPDGGMDVSNFTYVKTINKDPLIENISPNLGSQDTLIVLSGDNFLKPDPSVIGIEGMGLYRLIGTRVLLDNKDINLYNDSNNPKLEPYIAPNIEKLFTIQNEELILSQFYKNTIIKSSDDNLYNIKVDTNEQVSLSSNEREYIISLNETKDGLIATNENDESFELLVQNDSLTINESTPIVLNVNMDNRIFTMKKNSENKNILNVADYYNSIILEDEFNNFYTIDINSKKVVTLSDGNNNKYTIELDKASPKIVGVKDDSSSVDITINNDRTGLIIEETTPINLAMHTPYLVDNKNVIVGHRVKVTSKNQLIFTVPQLDIEGKGEGWYNVTVKNPDTKFDTKYGQDGFYYYVNPSSNPEIIDIYPSQGSVDGGYSVVISGKEFEDESSVYIDGVKLEKENIITSSNGKYITIIVPPYSKDITKEFETDRKEVPVVIVNKDGGSASLEKGFTYVIPSSHPELYNLTPDNGKASGGSIIEITGYDFRYFEPYKNKVGGAEYNEGDEVTQLTNPSKWDSLENVEEWINTSVLNHEIYTEYYTSPILPKIYFGEKEAKIVDFSNGYLKVVIPEYTGDGEVDVYLVNNDAGISNTLKFTYSASKPKIDGIVPGMGSKRGGDSIEIIGSEFENTEIDIYKEDGINFETNLMPLVRFGDITNRNLQIEEDYSGRINNGIALVKLKGNLDVEYKIDENDTTVRVMLQYNDTIYKKTYNYDDTTKFISLNQLTNNDGEVYEGDELIRIEVQNKRFLVDRGFSTDTELTTRNQIKVTTPSYHTVGKVPVTIINPDTGKASTYFEYKNPGSNPNIKDITPKEAVLDENNDVNYYIVESSLDGGVTFKITGSDFRKGVTVLIGSKEAQIVNRSKDDNEITVKAPKGDRSDLNRALLITVQNEDGAIATSKDTTTLDVDKPIYYVYRVTETYPTIEEISPDTGSSKGGERVVISGYDFRPDSQEDIIVRFGANEAKVLVSESTYKKLVVETPRSDLLGDVDVFIRNTKDFGETILENGFTYYSNPAITSVSPSEVYITGGQEVTIKGTQFIENVEVYIDDIKAEEVTYIDENNIKIVTPKGEEGYKDIKIVASDGGEYTKSYALRYILPIPSTPTGFRALAGKERSIVLSWNEAVGALRYKIYAKKEGSSDYVFIGETSKEEYYLNDLDTDTRYYFKLYSVNEYGQSRSYTSTFEETLKNSEDKGNDKYSDTKLKYDLVKKSTKNTIVQFPNYDNSSFRIYSVDLRSISKEYTNKVQINIPINSIKQIKEGVDIFVDDIRLFIPIKALEESTKNISSDDDTNLIINTTKIEGREKVSLSNKLSRNEEFISDIYKIEFSIQEKRKITPLYLSKVSKISITPKQNINNKTSMVKFDEVLNKLVKQNKNITTIYDMNGNPNTYLNADIKSNSIFGVIKEK